VIENSGWSFAATVVAAVALFVETVVLARYLTPAGYGVLLLLIAFPEAVLQLLDFRIREAMTRYLGRFIAQDRRQEAVAIVKLLWLLEVGAAGLAFLIVLAFSGWAANAIVDRPDLAYLMVIYAGGLFFAGFDSASGTILRVLDRFALSFGVGCATSIVRLAAILAVVVLGGGLTAIIVARVAAEVVGTVIMGTVAVRALARVVWDQRHAPIRLLRSQLGEIARFLVNTNLAGIVRAAATKLDVVLVGLLASPSAVSLYKVSIQVATAPLLLGDALFTAVFPSFARSEATGRRAEMREVARRTSMLVAAIVLPTLVIFAVVGGPLIGLVFGSFYRAAGLPVTLCLIGVSAYVIFFWAQPLMLASGHAGPLLRRVALATAVQCAMLAGLVPPFGATGAAAALGGGFLVTVALELEFVRRRRLLADGREIRPPPDAVTAEGLEL
jgi:O-antigen/teichoic acid export membrane protein